MTAHARTRHRARLIAQIGAFGSAIMLVVTAWSAFTPSGAATNAGNATVAEPTSGQALVLGGSSTPFTLKLPDGAACTGDSPNAGYKVQSYMVPSSVDPGSLQFGGSGPTPPASGANFRRPLFIAGSQAAYVNAQTAAAPDPGGPGTIVNIPTFDFTVFAPGDIPAGTYNVGIACTLGPASTTQVDKFWVVQMTFVTNPTDSPAQVTWTAQAPDPNATTTTTAAGATTTTTAAGATTTTVTGATTTAAVGATSTTSAAGGTSGSDSTTPTAVAGTSQLPLTGGGWLLAVWAGLLLIFGRMAVVLGKPLTIRYVRGR